ncbi:MAG: hypothetical protein OQK94_04100 [Gammaproteobacteria bacterium]|nr:hypothetical protein [Gammaproteobacteria bacterium]MCW8959552.1 hypothetical protein [Gammaproteobacteria bacterium]MCW8971937.1 hypothetical protein [Gammaproteobacteria bacterium]MCW8992023.1 hypothetical protein [Gammaproteobacteria bacterium]
MPTPHRLSLLLALLATPLHTALPRHRGYHNKNPLRYTFYHYRCGRTAQREKLWGK